MNAYNPKNKLKGANVELEGQLPPCPNCHRAMQHFAKTKKMANLSYEWKDKNGVVHKINYPSLTGSSEHPKRPLKPGEQRAEKLLKDYKMHDEEPDRTRSASEKRAQRDATDKLKFDNSRKAWDGYRREKKACGK